MNEDEIREFVNDFMYNISDKYTSWNEWEGTGLLYEGAVMLAKEIINANNKQKKNG